MFNVDGFVESLKTSFGVIPAKAGIQCFRIVLDACLRRACPCGGRGMTEFRTFYEFVNVGRSMLIVRLWRIRRSSFKTTL
jgi:hypothetical protein